AASCGGEAFTSAHATGGAAESGGRAGDGTLAGQGAGGSTTAVGGSSANSGVGGSGNGEAGAETGTDGCTALGGSEFDGHCYIDATADSVSAQQAVTKCKQLASDANVSGHLLVLDSREEQSFVLRQFLIPFTDVSDAWLGLTCSELAQPDIEACYCSECPKALLAEKQQAWTWLGGASSTFGWVNANPNGGYRCAALAYNPETTIWGWVDRPCDKTSITPISGHPHGYRVLCELEL
ncbi:MAG TPA: C-type lectin domain-containing protein, partial [Polyangiaceae bacterium]|nr:C-type lectin domain-containing protein [Polyangiaceae bacterium]